LKGKYRLRVFTNGAEEYIFGPKREEVIGVWRKQLHGSFITCTVH
jgi:hypothetical protein